MNTRTEFHAAGRPPNERVKPYMANCERAIFLQPRDTVEEVHVRVRKDDAIQRGLVSAGTRRKKMSGMCVTENVYAYIPHDHGVEHLLHTIAQTVRKDGRDGEDDGHLY
jgi:hypothetical protein